jgi:hypothetical protein
MYHKYYTVLYLCCIRKHTFVKTFQCSELLFGLYPLSGILNRRKQNVLETLSSGEGGSTPTPLGLSER